MAYAAASRSSVRPSAGPGLGMHLVSDLPRFNDIRPALERIDAGRWYTNFGPLLVEFEHKISELLNAADRFPQFHSIHVASMATCYQALEAAFHLLDVPKDGQILVPAVTFPACPLAVRHAGCRPVFADVDPSLWTLTPATARRAAQKMKLAAVMPVAVYGIPLPIEEWNRFSDETGIPIIIDAAAAIETQQIPRKGIVAHSLHATKPFGVGEGGLLVARDPTILAKARLYSNFGTVERIAESDGVNAKMSEYHAAVGLAQAARWPSIKKKREDLLALYQRHLRPLANRVVLHPAIEDAVVSLLMLRCERPLPLAVVTRAKEEGLALHRTYLPPLYRHPYFAGVPVIDNDGTLMTADTGADGKAACMMGSETMLRHVIGIPFHPFLEEEDVESAVASLRWLLEI